MIEPTPMANLQPKNGEDLLCWLTGRKIEFVSTIGDDEKCLPYIQFQIEGGHTLRVYTSEHVSLEWFLRDEEITEPLTSSDVMGATNV